MSRAPPAPHRATLRRDAAALGARLPDRSHVLNACTDRYRFMVALLAAQQRGQISVLAPSGAPAVLRAIAEDYPDLYAITDGAEIALPSFAWPAALAWQGDVPDLAPVTADQPALVLFTSGSTGRPKPVPKNWGPLLYGARAAGRRLGLARLQGATLIATVPHQHSYGLESVILLCLEHGLRLDASTPLYPADIKDALAAAPRPRILVTAPVHLRALLAEPGDMPTLDLILSATAPLPAALAVQAEASFGGRLIEIYGCTEAGQVATRRTACETAWHCLEGVALRQDEDGTTAHGPAVAGIAPLHDAIEMTGPDMFVLGARAGDLVDVAGKRMSVAHLNHQLTSIPGVADGAFFMEESSGPRVARLIALAVAPALRPEEIMRALRARIDPVFLPRPLIMLAALPRNELGKLPRETLLRLAAARREA